jgi:hypothetical protein
VKLRQMRIYIAGPISGFPERNEPAFRRAARELARRGHVPVVPLDIKPWSHPTDVPCPDGYNVEDGHSSACWLRADLRVLLECHAVYMLAGWERSQGASIEHRVAVTCGLQLYYAGMPQQVHFVDVEKGIVDGYFPV